MKNNTIASEAFSSGKKNFFLDFKIAKNNTNYITITRSDEQNDHSYLRKTVVVFQEDFEFLIAAFSSLFYTAAHAEAKEKSVFDLFTETKEQRAVSGLKSWDKEKRPREKFLEMGSGAMTNAELMAMLIGSGLRKLTAVDLAEKVLEENNHILKTIGKLSHDSLAKIKGIGLAKASSILAALELGKRAYWIDSLRFESGEGQSVN